MEVKYPADHVGFCAGAVLPYLHRSAQVVFITPWWNGHLHPILQIKHQDVRQLSQTAGKWQVGSESQWSAPLESHCRRELEKVSQFCPIQYLFSRSHETS